MVFDVNLYIEISHGDYPWKRNRYYLYILECELRDGTKHTRGHSELMESASLQEAALAGMVHAAGRMKRPSRIHIYTMCQGIYGPKWIEWLRNWQQNGFLTAHGDPLANRGLWERMGNMLDSHSVSVQKLEHTYRNWMVTEMERNGRKGVGHKDYNGDPMEENELEKAWKEARSLDPDRRKWPRGLKQIDRKPLNGRMYILYRDDNTEDREWQHRYDSEKCESSGEGGTEG